MTATGSVCAACGIELPPNSKFCNECGAAVSVASKPAEYKQVSVLFADVVHSMDIAATVGAERLREIMADLAGRCAAVVRRYGGTVDKFTGDGIMAVFGAPVALEDHAVRACLAALGVQQEAKRLAAEVKDRDGVDLRLRVGLNSGQVIAGEIGSGPFGYTAIGDQVGLAQRMESVAPPGGVMLSASTARLVEGAANLGEYELVRIKGADAPVPARRLLGMGEQQRVVGRAESNLVGRQWEMSAVEGLLERAIGGDGAVVGVVGSTGIGKSRLVREVVAIAGHRGVEVFTTFCESHASQVPFHAVARLLRAATGVEGLDGQTARVRVRDRVRDADPEDLLLLLDLLGIADPNAALAAIDPDARRRQVAALARGRSQSRGSAVSGLDRAAVGGDGRAAGGRFRHAAPPGQCVPVGRRVRRAGVVDAEDMGAPLGAVPGRDRRRAGRAHGRQDSRRSGVHRQPRQCATRIELEVAGVRTRRRGVPADRPRLPVDHTA
jgi:class 3 adenylate cyclase